MVLLNVRLYGEAGLRNIKLSNGTIGFIEELKDLPADELIDVEAACLLPGFVNSHDHLDFNSFPRIGNRIYSNYREWGEDIHQANKEQINKILSIPLALRVRWGLYKNLLNGFTTVVNHGEKLEITDDLVHVIQDFPSIHSVSFERGWKKKLLNPFGKKPMVMHLGEGVDVSAFQEINQVIRKNFFRRKIIAVHGVAMNPVQAGSFAALVWCPSSNHFLFGKTADIASLKDKIPIVFGTDSTLTSTWNAWEQFRETKGIVSETELVSMLTENAIRLWDLRLTGKSDLILVKDNREIFQSNPEDILLVMQNGIPRLLDQSLAGDIKLPWNKFSKIRYPGSANSVKFVQGDLQSLIIDIKKVYPEMHIPFEAVYE